MGGASRKGISFYIALCLPAVGRRGELHSGEVDLLPGSGQVAGPLAKDLITTNNFLLPLSPSADDDLARSKQRHLYCQASHFLARRP